MSTSEPRALAAALDAPPFAVRAGSAALHVANRHADRWAPEGPKRAGSLASLGFVDKLISPWFDAAARSTGARMFGASSIMRDVRGVSWVFPRPWYHDELDWMAAAREQARYQAVPPEQRPQLFTTRGTFVPPQAGTAQTRTLETTLPRALFEYVAPSLSALEVGGAQRGAAAPTQRALHTGSGSLDVVGRGAMAQPGVASMAAYSPLVPFAAASAAQVMAHALAPLAPAAAPFAPFGSASQGRGTLLGRNLGDLMASALALAGASAVPGALAAPGAMEPTRISTRAPELVTPPAPRAAVAADSTATGTSQGGGVGIREATATATATREAAMTRVAAEAAVRREQLATLERAVRAAAERELAVQRAATTTMPTTAGAHPSASATAPAIASALPASATVPASATSATLPVSATVPASAIAPASTTAPARSAAAAMHFEQARAAAARDARALTSADEQAQAPGASERGLPAAIAALDTLAPDIAPLLAASFAQGGVAGIAQLRDALRTAELLAHATARGETVVATRGPRVVLPAMLGALPIAMEQARPSGSVQSLVGFGPAYAAAPTALDAVSTTPPAALGHVAWTDRWLARFAGAQQRSLATFEPLTVAASSERALELLASTAPSQVFVAPSVAPGVAPGAATAEVAAGRIATSGAVVGGPMTSGAAAARPSTAVEAARVMRSDAPQVTAGVMPVTTSPAAATGEKPVMRFDDEGETPDDVLSAIALAASGVRKPTSRARRAAARMAAEQSVVAAEARLVSGVAPSVATVASGFAAGMEREAPADSIARMAPQAPMAGLTAQLAASPFAAVLQHVLPLAHSPVFDVRALFGARLAAMYLAGGFASDVAAAGPSPTGERVVSAWDAAYVAPSLPVGATGATAATGMAGATSIATGNEAMAGTTASAAQRQLAQLVQTQPQSWVTPRSSLLGNSSLLALAGMDARGSDASTSDVVGAIGSTPTAATSAAEALLATLSTSMADVTVPDARMATAPGMLAKHMHDWSVVHERSTSDLAFDFVDPELLLAARVYGLGPAEAAQAARLAIGGQSQIAAMASAIDQTFLAQAFDNRVQPRGRDEGFAGAAAASTVGVESRDVAASGSAGASAAAAFGASSSSAPGTPTATPSTTAFGVEARPTRGITLWPAATVAALGLDAAAPDGNRSLAIAALEVLAARVVAELGTLATAASRGEPGPGALETLAASSGIGQISASANEGRQGSRSLASFGGAPLAEREHIERDVVASMAANVAPGQRERFQALYLALGQSSARSLSPAARAARALALVGRGGGELATARERAELAWGVLPQVFADSVMTGTGIAGGMSTAGVANTGMAPGMMANAPHGSARSTSSSAPEPRTWLEPGIDARPGLASLTARAGEALASYVAPVAPAPVANDSNGSSSREAGAMLRVPTAAQELVRSGRPSGRHGGGEVEIPPWFEAAARKMFEDKGSGDPTFALSELTLVTSASSSQIAASTRTPPAAAPPTPAPSARANGGDESQNIDIEKVANEVYRQILTLMDAARARNGEPYL
jgi:trimeric autotransporter adhesin